MSKTCLVVIYNHQYTENIEKVEKLYDKRFSKIYHIMPFYTGDRENVIPVYENSFQFNGYIAQIYDDIYTEDYDYYAFLGDDVVLKEDVCEDNIEKILRLNDKTGFTAGNILSLGLCDSGSIWFYPSMLNWLQSPYRKEIEKTLPDIKEMEKKFYNITKKNLVPIMEEDVEFLHKFVPVADCHFFYKYWVRVNEFNPDFNYENILKNREKDENEKRLFPFIAGVADFFVVPKQYLKKLCTYFGAFAAARIFVEVAVPTALVMTLDGLITPKDIGMKFVNYMDFNPKRKELPVLHNASIKHLYENWRKDILLIHPIKFSQWNIDIK